MQNLTLMRIGRSGRPHRGCFRCAMLDLPISPMNLSDVCGSLVILDSKYSEMFTMVETCSCFRTALRGEEVKDRWGKSQVVRGSLHLPYFAPDKPAKMGVS